MSNKSTDHRQKVNLRNAAEGRSVRRIQITTSNGKVSDTVYAVGGEEGVFAVSCEPDRRGTISLYSGDDGSWRYLTSYHVDWLKRIRYCLDLSGH